MSGLEPALALGAVMGGVDLIQSNRQAKAQQDAQAAAARNRIARLNQTRAIEEKRRKEKLRQQQATARAQFGARGLSPDSGSASAVLRDMVSDSIEARNDALSLDALQVRDINDSLAASRKQSLLEQSRAATRFVFDTFAKGISD